MQGTVLEKLLARHKEKAGNTKSMSQVQFVFCSPFCGSHTLGADEQLSAKISWDCLLFGPQQTQRTEQKKPQQLEKQV